MKIQHPHQKGGTEQKQQLKKYGQQSKISIRLTIKIGNQG